MGSISCHITPLVINSLRVERHTQAHIHTYGCPHRNNCKKPGEHWPAAGMHGLQSFYHNEKEWKSVHYNEKVYSITKSVHHNGKVYSAMRNAYTLNVFISV